MIETSTQETQRSEIQQEYVGDAQAKSNDTVEVKMTRRGKEFLMRRASNGKFAARERTIAARITEGRKAAQKLRLILSRKNPDTKLTIGEEIAMKLVGIIMKAEDDPKYAMAAVNSYKELMLRAYGKPEMNEDELEKAKGDGSVKVVILTQPKLDHPVTEWDDRPKPPEKPAFALTDGTRNEEVN